LNYNSFFHGGDLNLERFRSVERYFIIWPGLHFTDTNFLINFNFNRAIQTDPRFTGFLSDWPEKRPLGCYSVSTIDFLKRVKRGEKLGLISFATTSTEILFERHLEEYTFSFLTLLSDRGVVHTYAKIQEERDYVVKNIDKYNDIIEDFFTDDASIRVLEQRLASIVAMDHRLNIPTLSPLSFEYFNGITHEHSFVLKESESYVDVGASYGDTVIKFAQLVPNLSSSKIYAFEPNKAEFDRLNALRHYLPLSAYHKVVGAGPGRNRFLTDSGNVHGSRISREGDQADVVALDDIVDIATLVKIDAEGAEPEILKGAQRLLSDTRCRVAICAYHYPSDLLSIIAIMSAYGRRRAFLRQHHASLWDAILYFAD
jgi:FkbM family methyltransferase